MEKINESKSTKTGIYVSYHNIASTLLSKFCEMQNDLTLCDVTLEMSGGNIEGHACILAASSGLLFDILSKEKHVSQTAIALEGFSKHTIGQCVDYIYGKEIFIPFETLGAVKDAADHLRIDRLSTHCKSLLSVRIPQAKLSLKEKTDSENQNIPENSLSQNLQESESDTVDIKTIGCDGKVIHVQKLFQSSTALCYPRTEHNYAHTKPPTITIEQSDPDELTESDTNEANDLEPNEVEPENRSTTPVEVKTLTSARESKKAKVSKPRGVKPRICKHCNHEFKSRGGLRNHILKGVCTKPQLSEEEKLQRRRLRRRTRQYVCEFCGDHFRGFGNYSNHKNIAHERKFVCKYCKRAYPNAASLRLHVNRHLQIKEFLCAHCDYRSVTLSEMKNHEDRHHTGAQYTCEVCSGVFPNNYQLSRHKRVKHDLRTGSRRRFRCKLCDFMGENKLDVNNHLAHNHGVEEEVKKRFTCPVCQKTFTTGINRHMKKVHKISPPKRSNLGSIRLVKGENRETETDAGESNKTHNLGSIRLVKGENQETETNVGESNETHPSQIQYVYLDGDTSQSEIQISNVHVEHEMVLPQGVQYVLASAPFVMEDDNS